MSARFRRPDATLTPSIGLVTGGVRRYLPQLIELLPLRAQTRSATLARLKSASAPRTLLMSVYRTRNAPTLSVLLGQAPAGCEVRLWALDEIAPELAAHTVGVGPGPRFALLNRVFSAAPVPPDCHLVIADDDVVLQSGTLGSVVAIGATLGLEIFQPAHGYASICSYRILIRRPWLVARETTFVESGPLVVVAPPAAAAVFPLDESLGMGWGVEVQWWRQGHRLGVIDAVPLLHLAPAGRAYDRSQAREVLQRELKAAGLKRVDQLLRTVRRYRASDLDR